MVKLRDRLRPRIRYRPDSKVGLAGGMRTAYPSIEVYSYQPGAAATTIYQRAESGRLDDLIRKDQPIPRVSPRYGSSLHWQQSVSGVGKRLAVGPPGKNRRGSNMVRVGCVNFKLSFVDRRDLVPRDLGIISKYASRDN